jgi:uncharacterized membrane protein
MTNDVTKIEEHDTDPAPKHNPSAGVEDTWPKVTYFLYLASLILGITSIIGVIMAYIKKSEFKDTYVESHIRFQIRTFWIGLLMAVIGSLTVTFFIGGLILLWVVIWYIVRCVKGLNALQKKEPIAKPASWMFG